MADNMFRYWNQLSRNIPNNGLIILIFGMNWTNVQSITKTISDLLRIHFLHFAQGSEVGFER